MNPAHSDPQTGQSPGGPAVEGLGLVEHFRGPALSHFHF